MSGQMSGQHIVRKDGKESAMDNRLSDAACEFGMCRGSGWYEFGGPFASESVICGCPAGKRLFWCKVAAWALGLTLLGGYASWMVAMWSRIDG